MGYLDDGTMVVIEGARRHIGADVHCDVTSLVQTASGRMVFARYIKHAGKKAKSQRNHSAPEETVEDQEAVGDLATNSGSQN